MKNLLHKIQRCEVCRAHLPLGPRPVIQLNEFSKIVIISQAPSRRVHETGIPWNDASGKKLRSWMSVFQFYPWVFVIPGKQSQETCHHALSALLYGTRRFLKI